MEWRDIAIAIGGFVTGLIFNLFVKVLPTYIDLSKENQELREKVRELESSLEDERIKREQERDKREELDNRGLKEVMNKLRSRQSLEDKET